MDFSAEFVALRDRMIAGQDPAFTSRMNVQVAGRTAALVSSFSVSEQRKALGLVPVGGEMHAHEYRLLFAVPELDVQTLEDWWDYALRAAQELVQPDESHEFSIVSLILVTERVDRSVEKRLAKLKAERYFFSEGRGWMDVRAAVAALAEGKAYTSRRDGALKNVLKPFLQKKT